MKILTIITFTISNEENRKEFEDFLMKTCDAIKEKDQSTYISPKNSEEIFRLMSQKGINKNLEKEDHITIYYSKQPNAACQFFYITKQEIQP